jgi:hypothetical protein
LVRDILSVQYISFSFPHKHLEGIGVKIVLIALKKTVKRLRDYQSVSYSSEDSEVYVVLPGLFPTFLATHPSMSYLSTGVVLHQT